MLEPKYWIWFCYNSYINLSKSFLIVIITYERI